MHRTRRRISSMLGAFLFLAAGCQSRDRIVAVLQIDGGALDGVNGGPFGPARLIPGLIAATETIQDPTLSGDELEIFFTVVRGTAHDIWTSRRTSVAQPWSPATRVEELSSEGSELEPELVSDGLTIYFCRYHPPAVIDYRLFVSRRASRADPWGAPQQLALGDPGDDRGPSIDSRHRLMVFSSARLMRPTFDLYLTEQMASTGPWTTPRALTEINSIWEDWDAGIYRDGLALVFGSRRGVDHSTTDFYQSARATLLDRFGPATPLVELNTPMSEGDPWLSNDGRHIVFTSDVGGIPRLYEAWR